MQLRRAAFPIAPSALAVLTLIALASPPGPEAVVSQGTAEAAAEDLAVVVERTEFKWSKTGRLLGHLVEGTPLERLGGTAGWTRVRVRAWMWRPSLEPSGDGYEVTPEQENLRHAPNGAIRGQLVRGVEVTRTGERGRWYQIAVIGWVPDVSVGIDPGLDPASEETASEETVSEPGEPVVDEAAPDRSEARPAPEHTPGASPAGSLSESVPIRSVPGGAVVATLPEGLVLRPIETRGAWTRVAVEGWVPSESVRTGGDPAAGPAAVALSPEAFEGRLATWTLEHVALQRADRWRTDFETGEHYALTRVPGGEGRYVYLVVPDGLLDSFRRLSPFETIRVEGRIRTGKSALTGNPILMVTRILP